jgi:hypothetical protein
MECAAAPGLDDESQMLTAERLQIGSATPYRKLKSYGHIRGMDASRRGISRKPGASST